ncbi:MAG: hypothetical protein CM15mP109_11070 [Candidatus Dadabacteria bacterium]|nr:MAG: hypothetical protein CM15mP109_11070 [Candidatus Dadabacteria bacterium]
MIVLKYKNPGDQQQVLMVLRFLRVSFLIIDDGSNTNNDTLNFGGTGDDIFRTSGTNMFNADDVFTGGAGEIPTQIKQDFCFSSYIRF